MSYPAGYRGYDVDGVLVEYQGNGGIIPIEPYCIITGNTLSNWKYVVDRCGSEHPIYASPYGVETQYNDRLSKIWKADMVKKLELIEFYDDREEVATYVKKKNPNCKVFLVVGCSMEEIE